MIYKDKSVLIHISISPVYKFEGWVFEWFKHKPFPPHPLKKNGELRKRVGDKFWYMFSRFSELSEEDQEKRRHLI